MVARRPGPAGPVPRQAGGACSRRSRRAVCGRTRPWARSPHPAPARLPALPIRTNLSSPLRTSKHTDTI